MNRGAVLVAVLLVSSAIAPAGLALGQTDTNTYSKTLGDSPKYVIVNQQDIDGEFTVEISTDDGPGGSNVTLARQRLGPGSEKIIQFNNGGAYESISLEVTVHGSGSPSFGTGSERPVGLVYHLGSTGGDRDLTCDSMEATISMVNPYTEVVECGTLPGNEINTTNADAQQIKQDIYQQALDQQATAEIDHSNLDNRLQETKTQARIAGQNAYIRALNNGSTEPAARMAAKQAVADYYSVIQVNYAKAWELHLLELQYLQSVADNETGVSSNFVAAKLTQPEGVGGSMDQNYLKSYTGKSTTETLANGTSMSVMAMDMYNTKAGSSPVGITRGKSIYGESGWGSDYTDVMLNGVRVNGTATQDELLALSLDAYANRWQDIETQNQQVQSDMDVLVNNTYDAYQAGEINNSDLVDPYLMDQEMSPGENYQGWAASKLTMLGANSPETMDSLGQFQISSENDDYTGILMSQTNPESGQFAVNQTYDPANISGTQYVVTDSEIYELTTPFEITRIETTDGEARQNVTIEKTTYETADVNTTQLTKLYENLAYERAQWEAREQDLGGGGGGGFLGGGSIDQTVALLALAALAGAALLGNS